MFTLSSFWLSFCRRWQQLLRSCLKSSGTQYAQQRPPEGVPVPDGCLKKASGTTPPYRSPSRPYSVPDLFAKRSSLYCVRHFILRSCLKFFSEKIYGDILRQIETTVFSSFAPQKSEQARFCSVCRRFSSWRRSVTWTTRLMKGGNMVRIEHKDRG